MRPADRRRLNNALRAVRSARTAAGGARLATTDERLDARLTRWLADLNRIESQVHETLCAEQDDLAPTTPSSPEQA